MNLMGNKKAESYIVTKDQGGNYNLVEPAILNQYAIKVNRDEVGSKQIHGDWDYTYLKKPAYNPSDLVKLLDANTFHQSCVEAKATDTSGFFYTLNPTEAQAAEEGLTAPKNVEEFLRRSDINKTLYKKNYDKEAIGTGALEIVRDSSADSPINRLVYIPVEHLRRHTDRKRVQQKIGTKEIWFVIYGKNYDEEGKPFDVHAETGEIHPFNSLAPADRANELIWDMIHDPGSEYYGKTNVAPAIPAMNGDLSRAVYNTSFFKNFGMPAFAVTATGDFEDYNVDPTSEDYDETQTLKYKIGTQLKTLMKNPHSALVITIPSLSEDSKVDVKLEKLNVETREASFRLYRQDNRDEVLTAHQVPAERLGISVSGTLAGNKTEAANDIYKTRVITSRKVNDEQIINNLLVEEFDCTEWKFEISELDRADETKNLEDLLKLKREGIITPNEVRERVSTRFGLKQALDPLLDEYYLGNSPLANLYTDNNDPILDDLENSLMSDAYNLNNNKPDEEEEGNVNSSRKARSNGYVLKSKTLKTYFETLTERIQRAFKKRT